MSQDFASRPCTKPPIPYRRALLNFQYYVDKWSVHFVNGDCKTAIGKKKRYIDFVCIDELREFVKRCNPRRTKWMSLSMTSHKRTIFPSGQQSEACRS